MLILSKLPGMLFILLPTLQSIYVHCCNSRNARNIVNSDVNGYWKIGFWVAPKYACFNTTIILGVIQSKKECKFKKFLFHIHYIIRYEFSSKTNSRHLLVKKRSFFMTKWPYSWPSAIRKAIWSFKMAFFSLVNDVHWFSSWIHTLIL